MTEDAVNKPNHYQSLGIEYENPECIHVSRHLPFDLGNAYKYIWRAGNKGGKEKTFEDLNKALWYVNDAKFHTHKMEPSQTAMEIFSLLQFPQDEISLLKKEALWAIISLNFSKSKDAIMALCEALKKKEKVN